MWRSGTLLLGMLCLGAFACSSRKEDDGMIFMASTYYALVEGVFDGEITMDELRRHGDLGLGAVQAMDGELVLLDGVPYRVGADGRAAVLEGSARTPFAIVAPFTAERSLSLAREIDFDGLKEMLDSELPNANLPYSFRIEGGFSYVKTRSTPRQNKPYPRLIEVVRKQPEFEFQDVDGVIVGFRIPEHLESLSAPGYHFHFLTGDRSSGGHLLAFRARSLRVAAAASTAVQVQLPRSGRFAEIDFAHRDRDELNRIMGRTQPK